MLDEVATSCSALRVIEGTSTLIEITIVEKPLKAKGDFT